MLSLAALLMVFLTACGSGPPEASKTPTAPTATPVAAAPTATGTPNTPSSESPGAVQVADFKVVAYQGDDTFGGHDGHFAAAFTAGRPVVLLYFGGL